MAIMIGDKEYTPEEIAVLAKAGVLSIGEKHDTSSTTPTAQALHGVFPGDATKYGVFTAAGVRPGMFSTGLRVRSFGAALPMRRSEYLTEIIEIMTGVTAGSGNNATSACATAPKAGDLKTCQQTYTFGIIHIGTRIEDITQVGARKNRADVTREFYNMASTQNPWLPVANGVNNGLDSTADTLRAQMYTLAVELERNVSKVHFTGTAATEDNTYRGVARQWNGLDNLIKTGYTDAVTGLACEAADSTVTTFAAPISSADAFGRSVVEAFSDTHYKVEDTAMRLGMSDVTWALVMRPDLFRALTERWAENYLGYRITGSSSKPSNSDQAEIQRMRQEYFRNSVLPMADGTLVPVLVDDAIARETLGNNYYQSDVYGVPLSWAGMPLVYGEYFPMDNAEAERFVNAFGNGGETTTMNGGMYRAFRRVTKGCYEIDFYAKPRIILDTPFLAYRVDNLFYYSYTGERDALPGMSGYVNGGVSYRS